jgi:hypothetical protein
VKFTLTGDAGPVDTLAGLNSLVEQALRITHQAEDGNGGTDPGKVAVRVRSTPLGKVKSLEVSW